MSYRTDNPAACEPVSFTARGLLCGFRECLPLGVSVGAYGVVYGVLARQAGVTPLEAMLSSLIVFAGASQIIVLDLWGPVLPAAAMILTVFVVNLRHVLMGASLRTWLGCLPPATAYGSLFFMVDESWALSMKEMAGGGRDAAYLLGAGLCIYVFWFTATAAGVLAGAAVEDPARLGLDFAFTAVFLALLTSLWKGKGDLVPWFAAGLAAMAGSWFLPGKWYIICGGLAGGLAGACCRGKGTEDGRQS